jgi:hypothetical protein
MTETEALNYALGLCEEVARGGVDEAEEASAVLSRILQRMILNKSTRQLLKNSRRRSR